MYVNKKCKNMGDKRLERKSTIELLHVFLLRTFEIGTFRHSLEGFLSMDLFWNIGLLLKLQKISNP